MSANGGSSNGSGDASRSGLSGDTEAVPTALIAGHPALRVSLALAGFCRTPELEQHPRARGGAVRQRLAVFRYVRTDSGTNTARIATPQSAE